MISLLNLLSLLYYSMQTKFYETRPSEANDAAFNDSFIFHFLAIFSFLHSPRPTFLSSLLPRPLKWDIQKNNPKSPQLRETKHWIWQKPNKNFQRI